LELAEMMTEEEKQESQPKLTHPKPFLEVLGRTNKEGKNGYYASWVYFYISWVSLNMLIVSDGSMKRGS